MLNYADNFGGKVIKIRQGETAGINPFELEIDKKGNQEFLNILDKISEIRALLATICRNYNNRNRNCYKSIICRKRNNKRCKFIVLERRRKAR